MYQGENPVEHEFLCDNEEQLCSPTKPVAYLRHLDFGNKVVITDKTSVPFRGRVTIEEPQDIDMDLNSVREDGIIHGWPQFLPLAGAKVCLALKSARARSGTPSLNCIETNRYGEYALVSWDLSNPAWLLPWISKTSPSTIINSLQH